MKKRTIVNGWLFLPSSMVFSAFIWGVVQTIPGIMLKSLDVPNAIVGLVALLGLPLSLRFMFAPFIDAHGTKRQWVLVTQRWISGAVLAASVLCAAGVFFDWVSFQMHVLMIVFTLLSFMAVFHEVARGGYFLLAVDEGDKALFVGVNSAISRLAIIFSQGFMVMLAGKVQAMTGEMMAGWAVLFGVLGMLQLALMVYHHFIYPHPVLDRPVAEQDRIPFIKTFALFFELPRAGLILAFIFLYRLGDGLQSAMQVPFLMDAPGTGGLGLSLSQVGVMNGILTVFAMMTGGVIGGMLVKKYGLRKTIWPFAAAMALPNLGYIWLASHPVYTTVPLLGTQINLWAQVVMLIEALGYGIGFAGFGFLQCEVSRGPYRATFFAMTTSLVSLGWIFSGTISGFIQQQVGYVWLFFIGFLASFPGIALIAWLPLKHLEDLGRAEDAERHGKTEPAGEKDER